MPFLTQKLDRLSFEIQSFLAHFRKEAAPAPLSVTPKVFFVATLRIGDLVMTSALFREFKKLFPEGEATVLVLEGLESLVECIPWVDRVWTYKKGKTLKSDLLRRIREGNFDAAINICEGRFNKVLWASGIPLRVGYVQKNAEAHRRFLTHPLTWEGETPGIPQLFLHLLSVFSDCRLDERLQLVPTPEDFEKVAKLLPKNGKLTLALHRGASVQAKKWPYFAQFLNELRRERDINVVVVGGSYEAEDAQALISCLKQPALNLAGKTSLRESVALLSLVDLAIGGDSGPMNIARACGTPTLSIFGPTCPKLLGNAEELEKRISIPMACREGNRLFQMDFSDLQTCKRESCDFHFCMKKLPIELALKTVNKIFNSIESLQVPNYSPS